MVLDLRLED